MVIAFILGTAAACYVASAITMFCVGWRGSLLIAAGVRGYKHNKKTIIIIGAGLYYLGSGPLGIISGILTTIFLGNCLSFNPRR